MTREEAAEIPREQISLYEWQAEDINPMVNPGRYAEYQNTITSLKMAIEALSQESILDKIRAEIAVLDDADYDYEGYYKAVTDALQIIDKYKAESEDKG